ncbi:MAG TPA: ABC transporter permease subunit [Gemmatimonadaceae bacterium]|nr:ABC transporter permease subunit [Gemmatimonadaceae bacterium]
MIRHVAWRELLEHVRSARFVALCALTLLLLPLSAHVNATQYHARLAQAAALRSEQQRKIAEPVTESGVFKSMYGWRDGEVFADAALRAVRAPSRFAMLAIGSESTLPAYWQFSTEGMEPGPSASADAAVAGADRMDAVFIVETVLGLLALLLVFDAVSGERESGVLRLLLAAPVRRGDLLLGKALGAMLTLGVPLVLGFGVSLLVLEMHGVPLLRGQSLGRVVVLLAASALYLLNMVALGLAVSVATTRAKSSWVALLVVWIAMVLVIPRAADMVASTVHPVQPAFESRQAKIDAIRQIQGERARALSASWRRVSGADSAPTGYVSRALGDAYARAIEADEQRFIMRKRAAIRTADAERQRTTERRQSLARAIARLSAAASYSAVAANLAGTGDEAVRRWTEQVVAHQTRLENATFDRRFGMELFPAHLDFLRIIWWPDLRDARDRPPAYRDLPQFAYQEPSMSVVLRQSLLDLAVLAVGSTVWLAVALIAFQRAEVQ